MTDGRRLRRANGRVAEAGFEAPGLRVVAPIARQVVRPLCDLCRSASGARDKQLLFGARFHVLEERDGWVFGYDPRDGYVGYVEGAALGEVSQPTHRVVAQLAPLYSDADFKARDIGLLPFGSRLRVTETENGMARIEDGSWIMEQHIVPVTAHPTDWVHVAEGFFATPYLWGGNSALGIDCSGLVQSALWAADIPCPRDADMQEAAFEIAEGQPQRGDLVFWKGHVAIMVSGEALLHANLHHGTVARESLDEAVARISRREFGAVTSIRRPVSSPRG